MLMSKTKKFLPSSFLSERVHSGLSGLLNRTRMPGVFTPFMLLPCPWVSATCRGYQVCPHKCKHWPCYLYLPFVSCLLTWGCIFADFNPLRL